jgi:hypothetical protein
VAGFRGSGFSGLRVEILVVRSVFGSIGRLLLYRARGGGGGEEGGGGIQQKNTL